MAGLKKNKANSANPPEPGAGAWADLDNDLLLCNFAFHILNLTFYTFNKTLSKHKKELASCCKQVNVVAKSSPG